MKENLLLVVYIRYEETLTLNTNNNAVFLGISTLKQQEKAKLLDFSRTVVLLSINQQNILDFIQCTVSQTAVLTFYCTF